MFYGILYTILSDYLRPIGVSVDREIEVVIKDLKEIGRAMRKGWVDWPFLRVRSDYKHFSKLDFWIRTVFHAYHPPLESLNGKDVADFIDRIEKANIDYRPTLSVDDGIGSILSNIGIMWFGKGFLNLTHIIPDDIDLNPYLSTIGDILSWLAEGFIFDDFGRKAIVDVTKVDPGWLVGYHDESTASGETFVRLLAYSYISYIYSYVLASQLPTFNHDENAVVETPKVIPLQILPKTKSLGINGIYGLFSGIGYVPNLSLENNMTIQMMDNIYCANFFKGKCAHNLPIGELPKYFRKSSSFETFPQMALFSFGTEQEEIASMDEHQLKPRLEPQKEKSKHTPHLYEHMAHHMYAVLRLFGFTSVHPIRYKEWVDDNGDVYHLFYAKTPIKEIRENVEIVPPGRTFQAYEGSETKTRTVQAEIMPFGLVAISEPIHTYVRIVHKLAKMCNCLVDYMDCMVPTVFKEDFVIFKCDSEDLLTYAGMVELMSYDLLSSFYPLRSFEYRE
ncbi:hypothetical protein B6U83_00160 [Thermoplasmatales archaeon ex4484_36]|nr:MAG: hypothetical protein B6U83_00160 [Thermoplasmatales archaeon ex4484_36]